VKYKLAQGKTQCVTTGLPYIYKNTYATINFYGKISVL